MKRCACGEPVEDHVRYHWTSNEEGHYVDRGAQVDAERQLDEAAQHPGWPIRFQRSAYLWSLDELYPDVQRAPPPTLPVPSKPWMAEEELRRWSNDLMETLGYTVYDLEQGYREEGSTRQTEGIGDCYFIGNDWQGWIEYKRWDNEPSPDQHHFGTQVLATGGIYLLIYELGQLETWHRRIR